MNTANEAPCCTPTTHEDYENPGDWFPSVFVEDACSDECVERAVQLHGIRLANAAAENV